MKSTSTAVFRTSFKGTAVLSADMTVQCPFCEYEGMVASVEGHISGKSDEAHRGKVGRDLREYLPQTTEEATEETNQESYPKQSVEDLEPGTALVAASVVLAVVVLVGAAGSGASTSTASEEIETDPVEPEGWQ